MKRLLVFHPALAPYRIDFFNALGSQFQCRVVFLYRQGEEVLTRQEEMLTHATFEHGYMAFSRKILGRDISLGYLRELRRFRPDIVLTCEFSLPMLMPVLLRSMVRPRYRLFTMCDDSIDMASRRSSRQRSRQAWLLRRADGVVCISPETALWYKVHTPARQTMAFPIIRDERQFCSSKKEIVSAAEEYIRTYRLEGCRVALYVGRLIGLKNIHLLLRRFSEQLHSDSGEMPIRLVIVGSGEEEENLRSLADELDIAGSVVFAGAYSGDALMAWYRTAAFLVLPSRTEAFGAVVNEALLSGCPALVSDRAGARSIITPQNGRTFNPDDSEAFGEVMAEAFANAEPTPQQGFQRESLMPVTFSDSMKELKNFLCNTALLRHPQ